MSLHDLAINRVDELQCVLNDIAAIAKEMDRITEEGCRGCWRYENSPCVECASKLDELWKQLKEKVCVA